MKHQLKTHVTKKTSLCSNCENWINAKEFDRHGSICIKERPLSATDINEEYPAVISILR